MRGLRQQLQQQQLQQHMHDWAAGALCRNKCNKGSRKGSRTRKGSATQTIPCLRGTLAQCYKACNKACNKAWRLNITPRCPA